MKILFLCLVVNLVFFCYELGKEEREFKKVIKELNFNYGYFVTALSLFISFFLFPIFYFIAKIKK